MGTSARIDELRKKFEENPRRYFAPLANEYRKAGDLEQAIFICREYLPQQPGHMSGHIVYGQALYESGRDEEAKAVFETALSLDPENLIALRHLGDIARGAGDPIGARAWYQRVLDADPRNEEIMQLLSSLDSEAPGAAAPSFASTPDYESSSPSRTPVVEAPSKAPDLDRDPFSTGSEIEKSQEALPVGFGHAARDEDASRFLDDELDIPPLPPSHPAPPATTASDDDLLDLDDFSLGGVPMGASQPSARPDEPAPIGLEGDVTISGGFRLGPETDEGQFETDSFAAPSPAPEPDIELAADIGLGLTDDSAPASPTTADAVSLAGLETFEAGVIAEVPVDVPVLATESFFDLPTSAEGQAPSTDVAGLESPEVAGEPAADTVAANDSAPVDGGHDGRELLEYAAATVDESAAAEPPEAFVTETMAELYIQQGHLESALDIYRKLVDQRPGDPILGERLRAIEDRLYGAPAGAAAEPEHPPPPPQDSGPTIREFLVGLISRRPPNGGPRSSGAVDDRAADVERPTLEPRMTPGASETVTGSIDALFSGASASPSDAAAAGALASAFAETAPESARGKPTPLEGTPAHRAPDELSLDHVFKATTPPRGSGPANAFSFDQFFADEMTDASAESSGDTAPGSAEATDDIAQFNAWLNGLKKT